MDGEATKFSELLTPSGFGWAAAADPVVVPPGLVESPTAPPIDAIAAAEEMEGVKRAGMEDAVSGGGGG